MGDPDGQVISNITYNLSMLCEDHLGTKISRSITCDSLKFFSCSLIKSHESTERWKFLLTNRAKAEWDDVTLDKYQLIASEVFEKLSEIAC